MQQFSAVNVARYLLHERISTAGCLVDATAGNGNDTLFLAQNAESKAEIWSFDIQPAALQHTSNLLQHHGLETRVRLVLDSHVNVPKYIKSNVDVFMFNLGYMPGQNHDIMTMTNSTLTAVANAVNLLSVSGVISILSYPGHSEGQKEDAAIQEFVSGLSTYCFTAGCWSLQNHSHISPRVYIIEKVRSEVFERIASREN